MTGTPIFPTVSGSSPTGGRGSRTSCDTSTGSHHRYVICFKTIHLTISHDPDFTKSLNSFVARTGNPVTVLCRELAHCRPDFGPPGTDPHDGGGIPLASWFVQAGSMVSLDEKFLAPVRNSLAKQKGAMGKPLLRLLRWTTRYVKIARDQAEGSDRGNRSLPQNLVATAIGWAWRLAKRWLPEDLLRRVKYWVLRDCNAKPRSMRAIRADPAGEAPRRHWIEHCRVYLR